MIDYGDVVRVVIDREGDGFKMEVWCRWVKERSPEYDNGLIYRILSTGPRVCVMGSGYRLSSKVDEVAWTGSMSATRAAILLLVNKFARCESGLAVDGLTEDRIV